MSDQGRIPLSCPVPLTDATGLVQNAINLLASNQATAIKILNIENQMNPIYPIELDLAADCDYYFIGWNGQNQPSKSILGHIVIPNMTDFTFNGNGSTLHFVTPVAVVGQGSGSGAPYFMQAPPSTSAGAAQLVLIPQDGFSLSQGGNRILITNLNAVAERPILTVNGQRASSNDPSGLGIDWAHTVPVVDFGTLVSNNGVESVQVQPNQPDGSMYFTDGLRIIAETSTQDPQDPLTLTPAQEVYPSGGQIPFTSGVLNNQVVISSNGGFNALTIPPGQTSAPVKIYHNVYSHGSTIRLSNYKTVNSQGRPIEVTVNDLAIRNVNVYSAINAVVAGQMGSGLLMDHLNIVPPGGSPFHMVAPANNTLVEVASDLIVQNSNFYYAGDDNIDTHVKLFPISTLQVSNGIYSLTVPGTAPAPMGTLFCFDQPEVLLPTTVLINRLQAA